PGNPPAPPTATARPSTRRTPASPPRSAGTPPLPTPLVRPVRAPLEAQEVHHHHRLVRGTGQQGLDLLRGRVDRHRSPLWAPIVAFGTPREPVGHGTARSRRLPARFAVCPLRNFGRLWGTPSPLGPRPKATARLAPVRPAR